MTYRRELVWGALGYLAGVAVLRLSPLRIPSTFDTGAMAITATSMAIFGVVGWLVARRRPTGQRLAAAAALALPVLLGDAAEIAAFVWVYPNQNPASAGVFAAILLFTNLAIVSAGWLAEQGVGEHRAATARAA